MELPKGWATAPLEILLDYEQPQKYIVESTEYNESYTTPVLTAGKSFVIGHTNETEGIYKDNLPVIIFDDFTTATQFVTFPFKVKSSAMKMLQISSPELNIKYLYYRMQLIRHNATTHKRYWISDYSKNIVELPPLAEQHRIVAKIDALFSRLDKGAEMLQTIRQQLRTYRQAVLKWAFEGAFTTDDVQMWNHGKLGDVIEVLTDYHANGSYEVLKENVTLYDDENYAIMIRSTNFEKNDFKKELKYIDKHAYDFLKKSQLFGGELLMGKIGNAGRVYLMPNLNRPVSLAMNMFAMRFNDDCISAKYVYYYLISPSATQEIKLRVKGSTPTINKISVRGLTFAYPEINEQNKIVSEIESRLSVCDKLESIVDENLSKAEALRQSILKKAFAGQLVPQDPNDEPAEKLLERIKALKEATATKKPARRKKHG